MEEVAQRRAAEEEAVRLHDQQLQQLGDEEVQRQAAAQQAAVAVEHDPTCHIDIDAAIQECNRREQEWIQGMAKLMSGRGTDGAGLAGGRPAVINCRS